MNPYDNNPFETDNKQDPKNERDANQQLAQTAKKPDDAFGDLYDTIQFIAAVRLK